MYCKNCGARIEEDSKYCIYCGTEVKVIEDTFEEVEKEKKPAKVWKIFAKVSKIIGIVCIATCVIPLFSFEIGAAGVVFGILGGRAQDKEADEWRKLGINLSITGAIVSVVSYILIFVLLELL